MSTTEKLELFKSISVRNGQQELHSQQQERVPDSQNFNRLAGFLQNGKFSWIAYNATLRIISTDSGVEIAYYNFAKHNGIEGCRINCIEEVKYLQDMCIVAVCIEFYNTTTSVQDAGMISIFCVQGSKILGSMDMSERITSCKALDWENCRRSALRQFHGTLAIGTNQGKLFLVDLMIPNDIREIVLSPSYDGEIFPMVVVPLSEEINQVQLMHQHKKFVNNREATGEKSYFAILLKQVLDDSGSIVSFLSMPTLLMMAVGLDDGRMVLYDLVELQAFHLAYPPGNQSPLTHMSLIEPTDDPRSAVYIWAFHASRDGAIAVMHSIMFENRVNGYYENFRSCSVRLTMPAFLKDTFPVCCRSITKSLTPDEEEIVTINLLAWTSPSRNQTHIMIFDLNQWYKEEMPSVGDWRTNLKYAVVFAVPNLALDILLNEKSLMPFNSILRPEEHFFPNSLSFDLVILEVARFAHYHWTGVQNQVLQQYNVIGPRMIIEPSYYFNELLQVAISPQFYDINFNIASPIELKREFLLSVALEYNFTGFLKKCAWSWADGSYMGKDNSVGVGLSTLTEWIWNRVLVIKDISNSLCQPLFDFSEQRIDCGTQKQLAMCCKQLKNLSELLQIITRDYRRFIPENIQSQIQIQADTVKMAADYQEVLQWLLNVGLLPEGHYNSQDRDMETEDDFVIVPYPYRAIRSHYDEQRSKFANDNDQILRKYLFIDAFIEHECCGEELLKIWDCCYPPKSIQSLLRTLLIPDISVENKHVIFIYLFMDITNVLNDSPYSTIVRNLIKFPAVFKISPSIIKRTQAFWNLDNGLMDTAVEELISPLSKDRFLPKWQRELLIATLLKQKATSLALRALRCPGNPIAAELEMATLLANNLISEALKTQRASGNRNLLEKFFHEVLHSASYEQLLDLALTNDEGIVLRDYLQSTDLSNCVNVHFVYLLQRAKFIDAAQLMDTFNSSQRNLNMEPPKQVLNAYYSIMEPTTRKLTSMAYANSNSPVVLDSPLPLSVNLIHARCNATNDIYRRCVDSITEATHEVGQETKEMPFIGVPKLGVFEQKSHGAPVHDNIAYPMEFNEHGKRPKNDIDSGIFRMSDFEGPQLKRRRVDESSNKCRSFADRRLNLLTNFKKMRPQMNFSMLMKTPSTSSRTTPERQAAPMFFGEALNTPIVAERKTPLKKIISSERAGTPQSILKTRSCRSSVSPAHSQISLKSITFAALPDTRESSLNESYLEESFNGAEQVNSSAEIFYSPEKTGKDDLVIPVSSSSSIGSGPKPRPPIKSRSNSPYVRNTSPIIRTISDIDIEDLNPADVCAQSTNKAMDQPSSIDETRVLSSESSSDSEDYKPIKCRSILNSSSDSKESESDVSFSENSIYGFVRKSVLQTTREDSSDSSDEENEKSLMPTNQQNLPSSGSSEDDLQIAEDEHFEEEVLPEHSDYDDDSDDDSMNYGDVDFDDDSSSAEIAPKKKSFAENEIIELLDSDDDDDDVKIQAPVALPTFSEVQTAASEQQNQMLPSFNQIEQQPELIVETAEKQQGNDVLELLTNENVTEKYEPSTEAEMMDTLYDNIEQQLNEDEDIESPQFEIVSTSYALENPSVEQKEIQIETEQIENADNILDIGTQSIAQDVIPEVDEPQKEEIIETTVHEEIVETGVHEEIAETGVEEEIVETASENPLELAQTSIEITTVENDTKAGEIEIQQSEEVSSSTNYEMTENPLECARIEDDSKIEEDSEAFMSAASGMQVDDDTSKLVEKSDFDQEITENPLDMALVHDSENSKIDEKVNIEPMQESPMKNVDELSIKDDTEENPLEIAQLDVVVDDSSNMEMETSQVTEKDANDKEVDNILNTLQTTNLQQQQSQPMDLSTTTPKRARSKMGVKEADKTSTRLTRATSVPSSSTSSSPPISLSRLSRASSELHSNNPKAILKERMLESIAESSPGILTRSRIRLISQSSDPKTPQTPNEKSRAPSEETDSVKKTPRRRSAAGTPTILTPRRILTRAISKDSVASSVASSNQLQIDEKTPEEPKTKKRGAGKEKVTTAASDDEGDEVKSTKSGQSTSSSKNVKAVKIATPESSPIDELNVSNRRLTRGQLAVLEKSRELAERMSLNTYLRKTISDTGPRTQDDADDISDTESIKSEKSGKSKESRASSRRSARKRKLPAQLAEYDTASSTRSTRKSKSPTKKHQLTSIQEEESETSSLDRTTTRGRKK